MSPPHRDLLATLPVELLYEIQLYAASEAIPLTCRRLHHIFKSASTIVHADYLIARYLALPTSRRPNVLTYVLRFPLCTPAVLAALLGHPSFPYCDPPPSPTDIIPDTSTTSASAKPPELPRRLFRRLSPSGAEALPLLHFLYRDSVPALPLRPPPDVDSHDGYPLVRAVSAGAVPVVRFLLEHGASPRRRGALSVRLAIKRGDLALVRLLVEPPDERRAGKRRRLADRVQVNPEMLKVAVACGAHDIAEYLMNEKGCVPDLRTLSLLSVIHHNMKP
ncbi:hypothetical protein BC826DRAFT_618818 [Russula brevipes]|nr:hypothetical protein BC826DRAFT_618818 [Russula brevipes]